jgi:hypothetical protein
VVDALTCGGGALGIEELRPGAAPTADGLQRPAVSGTASMLAEHRRGIDKERIRDDGSVGAAAPVRGRRGSVGGARVARGKRSARRKCSKEIDKARNCSEDEDPRGRDLI